MELNWGCHVSYVLHNHRKFVLHIQFSIQYSFTQLTRLGSAQLSSAQLSCSSKANAKADPFFLLLRLHFIFLFPCQIKWNWKWSWNHTKKYNRMRQQINILFVYIRKYLELNQAANRKRKKSQSKRETKKLKMEKLNIWNEIHTLSTIESSVCMRSFLVSSSFSSKPWIKMKR